MKCYIRCMCAALAMVACPAWGQLLYDASASRKFHPSDAFSIFYNLPGSRPRVLIDDVTIPFAGPSSLFQVTRVTVKISRTTNAPAVRITPYYGQLVPDAVVNGGPGDGLAYPDPSGLTPFGLPQYLPGTGSAPFQETQVSFGNGTDTLFTVPGSPAGGVPGLHSFVLGLDLTLAADANSDTRVDARDLLALSNHWLQPAAGAQQGDFNLDGFVNQTDLTVLAQSWQFGNDALADRFTRNGWTLATQLHNLDLLWDYTAPNSFEEFVYFEDALGNHIIATHFLQIEGQIVAGAGAQPIPEPTAAGGLLGLIVLGAWRLPRRTVGHRRVG